jgi:uncharacterized protein
MIQIADHAEGCVVSVRAQPGARRNGIVGEQAGALKVAVTAPPDKGRANAAIIEVLADALGLKRAQVELIAGLTSKTKKVLLRGLTTQQARAKVDATIPVG